MTDAAKVPAFPPYAGHHDPTGSVLRCQCGALATHLAIRFTDKGTFGTKTAEPVCQECGARQVHSSDPPRRVEELSAWHSHVLARARWEKEQERAAMEEGQQRWAI